jgi:hypothetical protein
VKNKKLLPFVERQLYWLPYLTVLLFIWSEVLVSEAIAAFGLKGLFSERAIVQPIITFILLFLQLKLCIQPRTRTKAIAAMTSAAVITVLCFSMVEWLAPPVHKYSEFQLVLQRQLTRREKHKEKIYKGVTIHEDANYLGFIDRDRDYASHKPRVVFIGDSFLEIMSSSPLAIRVENLLRQRGLDIDAINLSKSDSGPDPDYRHKYHELAFDYDPDHLFVFLYSGNDLHRNYRYTPYHHPTYRVSNEAIKYLRDTDVGDATLTRLDQMRREDYFFASRKDLMDHLDELSLGLPQKNLIYLACLAYTRQTSASTFRQLWPNTIERIGIADRKLTKYRKSIRRRFRRKITDCRANSLEEIRDEYKKVLNLPLDQRLEGLARFVAHDYCGAEDVEPFLTVLQGLGAPLTEAVLEFPTPPLLVLKGVASKAAGTELARPPDPKKVARSAKEMEHLLKEFQELAKTHSASLTVVLIPVAAHADETFYRFWKPLLDARDYWEIRSASREALRKQLKGSIPTIDLMDFADQLNGGYWMFDGHWNETGNDAVARVIADYIQTLDLAAHKEQVAP